MTKNLASKTKSSNRGDGDRIFDGFGKLFKEVKHFGFEKTFRKLKEGELESLDLPPTLGRLLITSARGIQGKMEDIEEMGNDLKDNLLIKSQEYFQKLVNLSHLPTREEFEDLKKRLAKLEGNSKLSSDNNNELKPASISEANKKVRKKKTVINTNPDSGLSNENPIVG